MVDFFWEHVGSYINNHSDKNINQKPQKSMATINFHTKAASFQKSLTNISPASMLGRPLPLSLSLVEGKLGISFTVSE